MSCYTDFHLVNGATAYVNTVSGWVPMRVPEPSRNAAELLERTELAERDARDLRAEVEFMRKQGAKTRDEQRRYDRTPTSLRRFDSNL